MKKIIFSFCFLVLISDLSNAQVPDKFNYQVVIRDNTGELISNQNVSVRISILDNSVDGITLYSEVHAKTTNDFGLANLIIGDGSSDFGLFSDINWTLNDKYLSIEVDAGSGYIDLGTVQLLSVPYSIYSSSSDSSKVSGMAYTAITADALGSESVYSTTTDTLFVVKDHSGNVVFAVFPDGAQIIVNETTKGKVGGFAISGRSPSKAIDVDILKVTADSTRIYVNDTVNAKGKVGGFAVSGRSPSKSSGTDILFVTADSTRIFINEDPAAKGKVGGFAISGRSPGKSITNSYLQVFPDSTRIFVKDSVAGFGVANIEGGTSESFLNLNKQNYLIGHQTGSNTTGIYNSMIGYQAGFVNTSGYNNIFFGYKAGYSNVTGGNNVFIGTESGYVNQFTFQNTYIGYRSGYELSGASNTVVGSMAGENAAGGNNTFIGTSAGRIATGGNNTFLGNGAGYSFPNENTGVRNTYVGQAVGSFTSTGSYNVMLGFNAGYLNYEGSNNTFLGYDAGHNIHEGSGNIFIGYEAGKSQNGVSDKLFVSNWDDLSPLIYGDFNLDRLAVNGNLGVNRNPYSSVSLSVSPAGLAYGIYVDAGSILYAAYFNGDVYTNGSYLPSDEKFKKDIVPLSNVLSEIKGLQTVYYNWKKDEFPDMKFTDDKQIGFLANEVEKMFPELVKQDENGNKAVNYSKFTPILVEAINEQQKKIEELENLNKDLQQRLEKLEELMLK